MSVELYIVGGFIRDEILGLKSDDVDLAVEAGSFEEMKAYLISEGFHIYQEKPEFLTIKARIPDGHKLREMASVADFVLCRSESGSTNGRHPDSVEVATIKKDLARRDYSINAMARKVSKNGKTELIDPFGGAKDCETRTLRFVGEPQVRIDEDGLRVLRGFRFMVTKDMFPELETEGALYDAQPEVFESVSAERIREELEKMFRHDTPRTLEILSLLRPATREAMFKSGLRLSATLKK